MQWNYHGLLLPRTYCKYIERIQSKERCSLYSGINLEEHGVLSLTLMEKGIYLREEEDPGDGREELRAFDWPGDAQDAATGDGASGAVSRLRRWCEEDEGRAEDGGREEAEVGVGDGAPTPPAAI